jgi:hypothetical protein
LQRRQWRHDGRNYGRLGRDYGRYGRDYGRYGRNYGRYDRRNYERYVGRNYGRYDRRNYERHVGRNDGRHDRREHRRQHLRPFDLLHGEAAHDRMRSLRGSDLRGRQLLLQQLLELDLRRQGEFGLRPDLQLISTRLKREARHKRPELM